MAACLNVCLKKNVNVNKELLLMLHVGYIARDSEFNGYIILIHTAICNIE